MKLFLLVFSMFFAAAISGQKGMIRYEKRTALLNASDCKASEAYLKKKITAALAATYTEYPEMAVDFSSFKGQNGYSDNAKPGRFVYPYKVELLVYLRRKIMKEGKEKTELVTWKYDAVYEYATLRGGKCELKLLPASQITRTNQQEL